MPLYLHNGSLLVVNGALAASADCCCGSPPPPTSFGAKMQFWYTFERTPSGQYATGGGHMVGVEGSGGQSVYNSSDVWTGASATWKYCAGGDWGCRLPCNGSGGLGEPNNYGCGDGQAQIDAVFRSPQQVRFIIRDTKTWSQPFDYATYATLQISNIKPGTKVGAYMVNGSYRYVTTSDLTLTFDSTNDLPHKTNSNTIDWYVTAEVMPV